MKRIISAVLVLAMLLTVSLLGVSATENETRELFREEFLKKYKMPENAEFLENFRLPKTDAIEYEELYYHYSEDNVLQYVLVKELNDERPENFYTYGTIGKTIVFGDVWEASVWDTSFGIYDVQEEKFYDIKDVYNKYADLDKVFINLGFGVPVGDISADGKLTILDVTMSQQCLAKLRQFPECDTIDNSEGLQWCFGRRIVHRSDFDENGERDIADATKIQRYLAKIVDDE